MKISNYLYIGAISMLLAGGLISCEDDLEHYTVDTPEATVLKQSTAAIELSENNLNDIVYTITFPSSSDLTSDVKTDLGNGTYVLEYSLDNSFPKSATVSEVLSAESSNNSISFTGKDLNTIAQKLGATIGKNTTVYFRINHAYNERSTTLGSISNVVELSFTPIKIAATLQAVSKEDASIVYATLVFNEDTQMYEGEYTTNEWNFYLVDPIEGTIYGCDDDWTPAEDCNRSYKLVAGREIGDKYSSWFDPSKRPVIMRVNLNTKTWDWQLIPTDKKDLTGVSIIIVGGDMGWHNEWTPDEGVVVTANGNDTYTAVFENVTLTDQFGFRATAPAAEWIGPDAFESLGDNLYKEGNIRAKEPGIYTITVTAIANADGSITYKIAAEKAGSLSAKDLTDKEQGIKGAFDTSSSDWVIIGKVAPDVNDNVYTYTIANIQLKENQEFGFDGDLNWVGKGNITVNSNLISEEGNNLAVTKSGLYTFTLVATANSDGTISYTLTAEEHGE